jgi:hypothetical protein
VAAGARRSCSPAAQAGRLAATTGNGGRQRAVGAAPARLVPRRSAATRPVHAARAAGVAASVRLLCRWRRGEGAERRSPAGGRPRAGRASRARDLRRRGARTGWHY